MRVQVDQRAVAAAALQWASFPRGGQAVGTSTALDTPIGAAATAESSPTQSAAPRRFTKTERLGAFQWLTRVYELQVKTILDDQKKIAFVDDFTYDPLQRSYTISIQSLMSEVVEDTLTVQALGPNDLVLYEETLPITLDPDAPTGYTFVVPTDRGEPKGLRIIVHDPSIFEEVIREVTDRLSAFFDSVVASSGLAVEPGLGLTITLTFLIRAIGITLIQTDFLCVFGEGAIIPTQKCTLRLSGAFSQFLGGTLFSYL